ncbi:MAG: hypothetical protein KDI79_14600 [Anaerolineae bacterium]|nr:hypothetical protein [Anaerolineae bacterium]
MTRRQAYERLGLIVAICIVLAGLHSFALPLHKAADEIAHFRYSRFIAQHGRLPLTPAEREAADYKSNQPPLYHALVAALTGWSDSPGPPHLKFVWESARADLAQELLDTKRLANTLDERPPYRGAVLMWHLGRGVSILCGLAVIMVTFLTALELFSGRYRPAVISSAIIAFIPAFVFYSAALSYEPLFALTIGLYFLMLVKIAKGDTRLRNFLVLGGLMGLSVMVKYAGVILPVEAAAVLAYLGWSERWGVWLWLRRLAMVGVAAVAASAWWFLFLMINFNEVEQLGPIVGLLKPIIAGGGDTTQNYIAYQLTEGEIGAVQTFQMTSEPLWAWALQIFQTFWVEEIGSYPLGWAGPVLMAVTCVIAVLGVARIWQRQPKERLIVALLVFHLAVFWVLPLVRFLIQGLLSQTAQGRHVLFPTATMLPLLLVYGWQGWLSKKRQAQMAMAVVCGLACWSVAQLFWINTYYANLYLPIRTTADVEQQMAHPIRRGFDGRLWLIGYRTEIDPDKSLLDLTLYWQNSSYVDEDFERVIRLVQDDRVYLEWSTYPTNGRYPTRIWEEGETIIDEVTLPLIDVPPGDYQIQLQLRGFDGPLPVDGGEMVTLDKITVPATGSIEPDMTMALFIDQREVVSGVSLWQPEPYRQLYLPEYIPRMAIPIVWQGELEANEKIQWLLVSEDNIAYPAYTASPHFSSFMVGPAWLSGDYRLRAEVWRDDAVLASQETPPILTLFNERPRPATPPTPTYPLHANFGNQIELWGYDLPARSLSSGQGIPMTFYWQGLHSTAKDFTVFTKLFDEQQQLWASVERLPADGYHTFYWAEGEVVTDSFELPIAATVPAGVYHLNVGLYEQIDQAAVSLPLVVDGRPSEVTSVTFGPLKIGGPPSGLVVDHISPDYPVDVKFGDVLRLKGYDKPIYDDQTLRLKLYWQSVAQTDTDYTVFVHIRDRSGTVIAQMDRPPTNNQYPTSLWSPGEIIPDEIFVPLPDAQNLDDYDISVGLYDFTTGARLSIADTDEDNLVLLHPMTE